MNTFARMITELDMGSLFVPFSGDKPAALTINGHRLVILAVERGELETSLELVGADRLEVLEGIESPEEQEKVLHKIAGTVDGGVVIAPADVDVEDVIKNLEAQLPWVQ